MFLDEDKCDVLKLDRTNGSSLVFVPSPKKMTCRMSVKGGLQTVEGFEAEDRKLNGQILRKMEVVNQKG